MEWLLSFAILYIGIYIPFKYWQVSGKYEYLQKETNAKISQLEYNQKYYIDQINDYKIQVKNLSNMKNSFELLWDEAYGKLEEIENILFDEDPSELTDKIYEVLWREDGEEIDDQYM